MTYAYESQIYLGEVALNVRNLDLQTAFYQQILGLEILEQTDQQVLLGAGQEPLVRLLATGDTSIVKESYGLYHMALLLPSRQALADVFKHLAELGIPLVGGADHGYSEALYLEDPEGNGIELYRDKPLSDWDIRENGRIVGVTEELAAQDIYELGRKQEPFVLAAETRMGHVHLSVPDSKAASLYYQKALDLADKFSIPTGAWLASGNYHHHLAVNEWAGPHLLKRTSAQVGLAYFVVKVASKDQLARLAQSAQVAGASLRWLHSQAVQMTDENGLVVQVEVA